MAPSNKDSSPGSKPTRRRRPNTGHTMPVGGPPDDPNDVCRIEPDKPMEVVFTTDTFRRLIVWTLGPFLLFLIAAISSFFFFYHKASTHMDDPTIHLSRGERRSLETKEQATKERENLKAGITRHFDVKIREIKVEQEEQFQKLGTELKTEQKQKLDKILTEVRRTRRDIRGNE